MKQAVIDRLADRVEEIREFLEETDNQLLAAEFIATTVGDIQDAVDAEGVEGYFGGDVVYGTGC